MNDKIYNSFEKIFELSRVMPIGLMVYNAVEFVGVPIDVLARKFRAECDREFSSCEHACKAFLEYLCKFKRTDYDESEHFSAIISDEIKDIAKQHETRFQDAIFTKLPKGKKFDIKEIDTEVICTLFREHEEIHSKRPLSGFLENKTIEEFKNAFVKVIDNNIIAHFDRFKDNIK